jgi:hypothetical protein
MSIRALFVSFLAVTLSLAMPAMGKVIHVPADQPTIQAGINAASNGDTVLVSAGTYYENINFNGKGITVTSASGPAATVIDGSKGGYYAAVTFSTNEKSTSSISGFTLQNGNQGVIYIYGASPTVTGNIITYTNPTGYGGPAAVSLFSGGGLFQGNFITNTYGGINATVDSGLQIVGNLIVGVNGTGVYLYGSQGPEVVSQNSISANSSNGLYYNPFSGGATFSQNVVVGNKNTGVVWDSASGPIAFVSNTVTNNNQAQCCGGSGSELSANPINGSVTLENNLIVSTGSSSAMDCTYSAGAAFTNNDVYSAGGSAYAADCPDQTETNDNLSQDPLFADLLSGDYHLQADSPAVNAGTNSAPDEPITDFDGDPRIGGGTIDIGADEYTSPTTAALSAHALHFEAQDVGTSSSPQSLTLTNNGKSAMQMNLIATGPGYSQTNNCGTSLASGANCQISVTFSPVLGGTITNALGLFTSATTNPLSVALVGTGLAPQIQLPCCFYFYDQVIYTSNTQTGTLSNTGQAPLAISSIVYTGTSDFAETNNCPATLAVGASCTLSITYTPTIVGSESGTITFNDNAPGNPQVMTVSGSSVSAGVPTLNPTSLTFPTTLIGQSSAPQTSTLTNTGTGALGISQIFSNGDFPETNNCPSSLAVGASCTITVTYTPSYQGQESGYIYIYTDSSNFNTTLYVTGTGQAPVPTLSSLSLTSTPAGSQNVQVTATGTGFVNAQILWNGVSLGSFYSYGTTQISFSIPTADLITSGTYQISVYTPTPGGGVSNSLPFVVYQPINYAAKSTSYNYVTFTGTNLDLSYYSAGQVTSPFPIQFGGGSYSTLTVGGSGTISFSTFWSDYNSPIPDSQTVTLVAPFWDQLYPFGSGNDNNVFWEVTGTEPNRQLVVEWRDVGYCCETQGTVTFEVVFFEGSSEVLFNYADTVFGGQAASHDNGATASIGMQVSPSQGTQYSFDQASVKSDTALLWYPNSPTVTVSTGSLSFGYHEIGSKSKAQKVTITNGGAVPVTFSSITTNNGDFQVVNKCPATLNAGKTCVVHVLFDPSAPQTETATLSINDNATNSPQTVALTGTGSVTPILIYPILANFGNVPVGQTGAVPVVLANATNKPLTVQGITTTPSVYTETNNCGSSVAAGASCTINLSFTPVQQGNVTGQLAMALNSKKSVNEVKLVGSGK